MISNDILRSVRYTLDLSDKQALAMIHDGGHQSRAEELATYLLKETEADFAACPDTVLAAFLNGLINARRGKRPSQPPPETKLDNNLVLKKLRIAFALRDDDLHTMVAAAGSTLSRAELNAVFQKPDHKNFKSCGDQLMRQFLQALTAKFRSV